MNRAISVFTILGFLPSIWSQGKVFPIGCTVCNETKLMAWGSVEVLGRSLVKYSLPNIPIPLRQNIPEEPWVFEVTLNLDGKLCALRQLSGDDSVFAKTLARAVHEWTFSPVRLRTGPVCYQTRIHFYIRERNGQAVIEVPGVTSSL